MSLHTYLRVLARQDPEECPGTHIRGCEPFWQEGWFGLARGGMAGGSSCGQVAAPFHVL